MTASTYQEPTIGGSLKELFGGAGTDGSFVKDGVQGMRQYSRGFGEFAGDAMKNTPMGEIANSSGWGLVTAIFKNKWVQSIVGIFAGLSAIKGLYNLDIKKFGVMGAIASFFMTGGMGEAVSGFHKGAHDGSLQLQGNQRSALPGVPSQSHNGGPVAAAPPQPTTALADPAPSP